MLPQKQQKMVVTLAAQGPDGNLSITYNERTVETWEGCCDAMEAMDSMTEEEAAAFRLRVICQFCKLDIEPDGKGPDRGVVAVCGHLFHLDCGDFVFESGHNHYCRIHHPFCGCEADFLFLPWDGSDGFPPCGMQRDYLVGNFCPRHAMQYHMDQTVEAAAKEAEGQQRIHPGSTVYCTDGKRAVYLNGDKAVSGLACQCLRSGKGDFKDLEESYNTWTGKLIDYIDGLFRGGDWPGEWSVGPMRFTVGAIDVFTGCSYCTKDVWSDPRKVHSPEEMVPREVLNELYEPWEEEGQVFVELC